MAERKPVVLVGGQLKELPAGDTLPPQAPAAHSHATSDVTGLDAALAGKEPAISTGSTSQYWRGDKSWRDFFTDVRAATLTGLSTATNAVIDATDTVLAALGKLQKQFSDHFASTANAHPASAISNTPAGGISATSVQAAINELDSEKFNNTGGSISGGISVAGNVLATSGTLGYGSGAGGSATQPTSNTATVTLNKPSGRITMAAAMAAGETAVFQVNNSYVTQQSVIALALGPGMVAAYSVEADAQTGYFRLYVRNVLGVATSAPALINFAVINGSAT